MEVPIDQFKTLADVFGGILETYLEAYLEEHPDAKCIRVEPEDKSLTSLVDCLIKRSPPGELLAKYSSSKVLYPDTKFEPCDMMRACKKGHLEYAKWLGFKPIQATLNMAIINDHADVARWCLRSNTDFGSMGRLYVNMMR